LASGGYFRAPDTGLSNVSFAVKLTAPSSSAASNSYVDLRFTVWQVSERAAAAPMLSASMQLARLHRTSHCLKLIACN
jgi:hypothetical protein